MRVCYDKDASETIVFAAEELSGYLGRMLAGFEEMEGEIFLSGDGGPLTDGRDAYRIRMRADGGTIEGKNDRSVLLGVYDYLHRLGCRFILPQRESEIVPRIEKGDLAAHYEREAAFGHRGVCIEGADSFENIMDYIAWLPKVGYNSFFLQFKTPYAFLSRWYAHLENPYVQAEPYTQEDAQADLELFEQAARKRGLLLHEAGHGWTGEVLGYRTVSWNAGEGAGSETFSHRMALINGKRELFHGVPANTNLCYHNADAVDAFAELVADYAREHPQADYLHVWLADEYNNLCECPDCSRTTLSDQYVELLNEIDQRLTACGLGTRIVFLLYQELLWPPETKRLKHPERFVLMFAPISRTFEKSYEIGAPVDALPAFERNHITLPTSLDENMAFLRAWQAVFKGDSFVYDYPLGRAHYGDFGYVHIARVIHADIGKLRQMGLDGYISCQELRAAFPNALPGYVMGHTLFGGEVDVEELIEEYFRACYGQDWEDVYAYLDGLSRLDACDYVNGKGERRDEGMAERMKHVRELCSGSRGEITRRGRTAGGRESVCWEVLDYHREYVIALSDALYFLALGERERAKEKWEVFRELICEKEQKFQPFLDVYRVLEITRKYTGLC